MKVYTSASILATHWHEMERPYHNNNIIVRFKGNDFGR